MEADRREIIGGSDVAPILGMSPWTSPLDVWREKVGPEECQRQGIEPLERQDSEPMRWGRLLEPILCQQAAERTSLPLGPAFQVRQDWRQASIDATLGGDPLEVKTSRRDEDWGDAGTDGVPIYYLTQVAWYLALTGKSRAYVAALFGGNDFRVYNVWRDEKIEATMLAKVAEWRERHILAKVPPAPTTEDEAKVRWSRVFDGKTAPVEPVAASIQELRALQRQAKDIEEAIDACKTAIRSYARDAEALVLPDGTPAVSLKLTNVAEQTIVRKATQYRALRILKAADKVMA